MVEAQRALLDELMGTARNLTDEEKKGYKEVKWDDKEVCGCYLVQFCPHDLFVNTKSNLGPCPKIHDPKLKESFEKSSRYELYVPRFEVELAQFCEKLVQDLDRKIRRGRERLAQDVDIASLVPMPTERAEQLAAIEEKIKKLLEQSENLGEVGRVDEAQALMKKVDVLNAEKAAVTQLASSEKGFAVSQEKKMALCELCGSFLIANETLERSQSHVTGKQHIGYGMVRDYLENYKEKKEKAREERQAKEKEGEKRNQKGLEELERRKENGSYKDREHEKERGKGETVNDREQKELSRDREKERDQYRYRDWERGRTGVRYKSTDRVRDRGQDRERLRDREHDRRRIRTHSESFSPPRATSEFPARHQRRRRSRSPDS